MERSVLPSELVTARTTVALDDDGCCFVVLFQPVGTIVEKSLVDTGVEPADQYEPDALVTAPIVRARMLRSALIVQFST